MKIEKIIKKVGISVGIVGSLFGVYMLLMQIRWIIAASAGDFSMIMQPVIVIAQAVIIALFIYGFGEIIDLLTKINENLQNK